MQFKNKKIRSYQNLILLASIIPLIVFAFLMYNDTKKERIKTTFEYLTSLNEQNKGLVTSHFNDVKFNISELATTVSFLQKQATRNIMNIQELQKNSIESYYHGIENDILSLAKKDVFKYIFSFLERSKEVSSVYLDNIYAYKEELGIANVLMMDKDGKILYSSDDPSLLNQNVDDLSKSFEKTRSILKNQPREQIVSFIHTGYSDFSENHKQYAVAPFEGVDGYIAIEIKIETIAGILKSISSLGDTAETYLIYRDDEETYLSSNREKKEGKIGDKKSGTYINKGFTQTGTDIKYGSTGVIELVGYRPIHANNLTFSMQTTVAYTEVISPKIHGKNYFEQFLHDYNYNDVMMLSSNGTMFYSVLKNDAYQTNMLVGKYKNTALSKAVKEVLYSKKYVLTDIDVYEASVNKIAQFGLYPILRADKTVQSIVILELNIDNFNEKLTRAKGIYDTTKTYLVGQDMLLRSDVKSFKEKLMIETEAVFDGFANKNGMKIIENYRGTPVLSSYSSLIYKNFEWIVINEIDEAEVEKMVSSLKNDILMFILIASFITLIIMFIITNEKKKQDKKVHYTATHDTLTKLPNRKFALEFLTYILAATKRKKMHGAVLFIDLDKFKIINDSYGHKAGDIVLSTISQRLKKLVRNDDLIGRLGGDEFILIMNSYETQSDIDTLCKKIINEIAKPIVDEKKSYNVGLSIGISTFPDDSADAAELIQFADIAMFQTKENGRNNFTYYSKEMTEKSLKVTRVANELKNAIVKNELELYYQPQVCLKTKKVIGVESLVRWNHPVDGLIMPNDFIPIAEESTLILDLGYWVLYEACKNFKKWKDSGCELEYIAVNMSTKQLQCSKCVGNIEKILDTLDFNPEWLELEITETTLIENIDSTLNTIEVFKGMGIKFSIDDFGTGYSSLAYLKTLRISTLKIDREFIKDMIEDKDDRTIVEAIILMGHTLGYMVVAEGAETKAEVELLKYLACDIVQGYYYSKPLPENKLLEFIKENDNA